MSLQICMFFYPLMFWVWYICFFQYLVYDNLIEFLCLEVLETSKSLESYFQR